MAIYFDEYLKSNKFSEETIETYVKTINMFNAFLKEQYARTIEAVEVRPSDIKGFLESKKENGNSVQTINKHLGILKKYFDYLWQIDIVKVDPAVKIKNLKKEKVTPKDLNYEFLLGIKPKVLANPSYKVLTKVIFILAMRGFRVSEFHFKKSDVIDLGNKFIIETKRSTSNLKRTIELEGIEADIFAAHFIDSQFHTSDYVFTTKKHDTGLLGPITSEILSSQLCMIRDAYDLPKPFPLSEFRMLYTKHLRTKKHYSVDKLAVELGIEKTWAGVLAKEVIERYESR
ncbi:site-specific integrase [Bacillus sp. BRMEA1]|uniref:tyrosine-type recombinase/integrase n=1 Tax=Neobacillus endophyticus TaxID=2738405 RepID=UPI0015672B5E|nr:site-specific integrase [Neobacillus endophyticus]NRD81113.1 site-specific integrase [Neobacillus endophyticus]